MKKKLTFGTLSLLLCLSLSACTAKDNTSDTTPAPDAAQTVTPEASAATATPDAGLDTTITAAPEAATPTPDPSAELTSSYLALGETQDAYEFAVVYLGYPTVEERDALTAQFMQTYGINTLLPADCDGQEAYAVVPKYKDSTITVKKYTDADYSQLENVIETSDPVILFCNPSDLRSNVEITVTHNGEGVAFGPFISLKDGSVVVPEQAKSVTFTAQ